MLQLLTGAVEGLVFWMLTAFMPQHSRNRLRRDYVGAIRSQAAELRELAATSEAAFASFLEDMDRTYASLYSTYDEHLGRQRPQRPWDIRSTAPHVYTMRLR